MFDLELVLKEDYYLESRAQSRRVSMECAAFLSVASSRVLYYLEIGRR